MNPVTTYDFTAFDWTPEAAKILLNQHCKKWDFQEELTPTTSRKHLQGRFWLKTKERLSSVCKKFAGWHISITSKENTKNSYYVNKEESRINGPWSSEDCPIYIPRQVREIKNLYPWQEHILKSVDVWDTRTINVIVDTTGNIGKSTICTYASVHKIGRKIPFANDFRDIMRMVMDTPTSRLYLLDMPKALSKEHLNQFYCGIEEIKNGYAYDDRYTFDEKWFDCPSIYVFTNTYPDITLLARDRWKIWKVSNTHELVAFDGFETVQTISSIVLPDNVAEAYPITIATQLNGL